MTAFQKAIKYCAIAFAIFLVVSIIGGIVGGLAGISYIFSDENIVGEMQTYTVSEKVTDLEIDIVGAELAIKSGESFFIESNLKNLTVNEKNGRLTISEKSNLFNTSFNDALLKITVPAEFVFHNANIVTGAGRVSVDSLSVDTLILELGAGEVNIDNLVAVRKSEIDGGAGKVTITGGALANLDLDMGVGELNLTSALTGNCELDYGVGKTNLTLIGSKEDYTVALDKGLGDATVDGASLGDGSTYGSGENKIDIDGGVGAINIDFEDEINR